MGTQKPPLRTPLVSSDTRDSSYFESGVKKERAGTPSGMYISPVWFQWFNSFIRWDANTPVWMYRNTAAPGMNIDSSVTDKVLALKGGTDAYNVNGGNTGGDFEHNHQWLENNSASVDDNTWDSSGSSVSIAPEPGGKDAAIDSIAINTAGSFSAVDGYTKKTSAYRPGAAVGTLQTPDL